MNEAMEDGEIIDSDHEDFGKANSFHHQRLGTTGPKHGHSLSKKPKYSSESESDVDQKVNNTDDDDDEDDKKIKMLNKTKHSKQRIVKNKFGIWTNVMEDELLSGELTSWAGVNNKISNDRDVESYNFISTNQHSNPGKRKRQKSDSSEAPDADAKDDLAKLETFGVSQKKNDLHSSKKNVTCHRLKESNDQQKRKMDHKEMLPVNVSVFQPSTSIDDVSSELITILREPHHMKHVFELAVKTLGHERIYKLVKATEDVEAAGGLMILNGRRRRTPGGVFLHLLKSQSTKEEQELIFTQEKNEKQEKKKKSKESKKQLVDEKVQKLANLVNTHQPAEEKLFDDAIADIELDFC